MKKSHYTPTVKLDDTNIEIIKHLQENGRISKKKLARICCLTIPTITRRIKMLEKKKVITGYSASVFPQALGLSILAIVTIEVTGNRERDNFLQSIIKEREVIEVYSISGQASYIIKVRTKDTSTLNQFITHIYSWEGIVAVHSNIVLSTYKEEQTIQADDLVNVKS